MEVPHGQGPPYGEGMHPSQRPMQGQGMAPQGHDVRYLDPAPVEPNGPNPYHGRGDHMV
jgi:hypothetical protein